MNETPLIVKALRTHGMSYLEVDPDALHIKVNKYDEGLLVLNYCQIDSPKTHPVIRECRGLIVSYPGFDVVSRSFDRFFNYGEAENETFELQPGDKIAQKVDGSLIKLYYWNGRWRVSTRGTAFAESGTSSPEVTFADLFRRAAPDCDWDYLDRFCTYMFELTAPENRVVRNHKTCSITYLAARVNRTGKYVGEGAWHSVQAWSKHKAQRVKMYDFDSTEACVEAAKALPDLEEGYVVYRDGTPICKIKSPSYLVAHRLFSGPLTAKRVAEMVLLGETTEFVAYFPEFAELFEKAAGATAAWLEDIDTYYVRIRPMTQKEFALLVKDRPESAVLFKARALKVLPSVAWQSCKPGFRQQKVIEVIADIPGLVPAEDAS